MNKRQLVSSFIIGTLFLSATSCKKDQDDASQQSNSSQFIQNEEVYEGPWDNSEIIDQPLNGEMHSNNPEIILDNGSKIFFLLDENSEAIMALEEQECTSCSAIDKLYEELEKEKLSNFEIFWALSKPGQEIPKYISSSTHPKSPSSKPQGWARGLVEFESDYESSKGKASDLACSNSSFKSGSWIGGNYNFLRTDKTGSNYSPFNSYVWAPDGTGTTVRFWYQAQYNNLRAWKGKLCGRSFEDWRQNHHFNGTYYGPQLLFMYEKNGSWYYMKNSSGQYSIHTIPKNSTKSYLWHWTTSWDANFKVKIRRAKKYDEFDILMDK